MVYEVPVTQARAEFADLVNRVVYGGERVVVTRHGRPLVALISAADLDRLDQADEQRPVTVVRLSANLSGGPISPGQPARRPLDIAAEHRPPDDESGRSPG